MEPFEPEKNEENQDLWREANDLKKDEASKQNAFDQAALESDIPESAEKIEPAPDFNKPQPGESYADYLHRLDRAKEAEQKSLDHSSEEYWSGLTDYGRGRSGDPNYGPIPEEYSMNGMSKAAFVCGILSLVTVLFGFSLFFGVMGVLFALLSRKKKFGRQSRIALWMSAAGIFAFVLSFVITLHMLISSGIWGRMLERIRNMDANDPNAVAILQEELLDDILGTYGVQLTPGTRV